MSQQFINIGGSPNDGTGDSIRVSFTKTNDNFTELYSKIRSTVPLDMTGSIGDIAGTLAYDEDYLYICFGTYDGSSIIWKRVALAAW